MRTLIIHIGALVNWVISSRWAGIRPYDVKHNEANYVTGLLTAIFIAMFVLILLLKS